MKDVTGFLDDPGIMTRVRRIFWGAVILAGTADLALVMTHRVHGHLPVENIPFFGIALGLAATFLIVGLAKIVGARLLGRTEDYYG